MVRNTLKNRRAEKKTRHMRIPVITLLIMVLTLSSALSEKEFRPLPIDLSGGAPLDVANSNTLMVYEDPTIRVERFAATHDPTTLIQYYAADIRIKDPSQLRTAPADGLSFTSDAKVPVQVIAKRMNAVLAINGDYCTASTENKYVLRQGTVYKDSVETSLDMLLIDENGDMHIIPAGPELETMDKTQIDGKAVRNVFQFGPGLVVDGKPAEDAYILDENHSPKYAVPAGGALRMVLIQRGSLHYMAICSRYHTNLVQLRDLVLSVAPDCVNAYVLDGGGSSQMVFIDTLVNKLTSKPRPIPDIIYFASAWFEQ